MSDRKINQPMLMVAVLCLLLAITGLWLAFHDGGAALGLALLGFFGAGAYVLGRKSLGFD